MSTPPWFVEMPSEEPEPDAPPRAPTQLELAVALRPRPKSNFTFQTTQSYLTDTASSKAKYRGVRTPMSNAAKDARVTPATPPTNAAARRESPQSPIAALFRADSADAALWGRHDRGVAAWDHHDLLKKREVRHTTSGGGGGGGDHILEPRTRGAGALFTVPKHVWRDSAPLGAVRVVACDASTITYTYETSPSPAENARRKKNERDLELRQQSLQQRAVLKKAAEMAERERVRRHLSFNQQQPTNEQQPRSPPPLLYESDQRNDSSRWTPSEDAEEAANEVDVIVNSAAVREAVMQVVSLSQVQQQAAQEGGCAARAARTAPDDSPAHGPAPAPEMKSTPPQPRAASTEEERATRALGEVLREIAIMQRMQAESNRLNHSLMVQLEAVRSRTRTLEGEREQHDSQQPPQPQSAHLGDAAMADIHSTMHQDWQRQQDHCKIAAEAASAAITAAVAAAQAARQKASEAAELSAAASRATARELEREKILLVSTTRRFAEERDLRVLLKGLEIPGVPAAEETGGGGGGGSHAAPTATPTATPTAGGAGGGGGGSHAAPTATATAKVTPRSVAVSPSSSPPSSPAHRIGATGAAMGPTGTAGSQQQQGVQ